MLALIKASESDGIAIHPLHERAVNAAGRFRRAESDLIEALLAVDRERVFLKLGYSSLFRYAVESLKLSEDTAYNFVTVARKTREAPALLTRIQEGLLTVSKARKIAPVLKLENQDEWIERAQTLTSRQLEKEVARENPRLATPERAKYVSGQRIELTLGVEETLMLKIRRAQDQVSRSKNRAVSLEETLEAMADFYLKHHDPVEKAKRVIAKKGLNPPPQKSATAQQNEKTSVEPKPNQRLSVSGNLSVPGQPTLLQQSRHLPYSQQSRHLPHPLRGVLPSPRTSLTKSGFAIRDSVSSKSLSRAKSHSPTIAKPPICASAARADGRTFIIFGL